MRLRITQNDEIIGVFPWSSWENITLSCANTRAKGDITIEELLPTLLLSYSLSADGTYYICKGSGNPTSKSIEIPEWYNNRPVQAIDGYFANTITDIVVSKYVTSIGTSFRGLPALTTVLILGNLVTIYAEAFKNCYALKNINIPTSVDGIQYGAFYNCTSLSELFIPKSVTKIESTVFQGCSKLTSIIYSGTTTEWESIDKADDWAANSSLAKVICSDGEISI